MPNKKKKVVAKKKAPVPKPSTLLASALALFGPKGEHWVKGAEKEELEAGFVDLNSLSKSQRKNMAVAIKEADRLTKDVIDNTINEELRNFVDDKQGLPPTKIAADMAKLAKELEGRFVETPAHIAWCSIGAVCEINTPNESKAANWLARAIFPQDEILLEGPSNHDRTVIIRHNDGHKTTWLDVKGWFTKAIKLAKAAGQ